MKKPLLLGLPLLMLLVLTPMLVAVLITVVSGQASMCQQTGGVPAASFSGAQVRIAHANLFAGLSTSAFGDDLAQVVAERPDFVTLNETYKRSRSELTPPGYAMWRAESPYDARETPVLWRTDTWRLVDKGTLLMHQRPVKWGTRYVNWVTLESTDGARVSVISGHASPGGAQRADLLKVFVQRLNGLISDLSSAGPVLVGADLNAHYPASPFLKDWLAESGTTSTFDALGEPDGGWVTGDRAGIIDYVLVAGAEPTQHATHPLGHSDHRMLTATITLPGDQVGDPATAPDAGTVPAGQVPTDDSLGPDATQWKRAAQVVGAGKAMGIPEQGILIALAVASQESGFRVYANDGHGGDLEADQQDIERSLQLPHDAVGTDHGSLGVFQQQWPWWGSMEDLMDPATSAQKFYAALVKVPDWQNLPLTVAAQTVQRSAYPTAYADDEPLARDVYAKLAGIPAGDLYLTSAEAAQCATAMAAAGTGSVVFPVPANLADTDNHNWGDAGSNWSSWHTGTDFSVPCGTPVLAAHAGTIEIDTTEPWAGPWLVKVTAGPHQLTTWYAHMQKVLVTDGDVIQPGQQIGEVGAMGNATGCHLHFEVHTANGSIYGPDNVDPSTWLADHVGKPSDD